ncbi:hypothetical protein [Novosphingobium sp. FKTRR1]|uniref:hypothetical protein n=1 Tax=unclassified Novosphingobium TaxID=2644732 RepID=UPI001CF01BA1|nr:hypothetical protein [Novosphingobium sp. FKTRR1]
MSLHFRALADQAVADGTITPDEVLALRREAWPDGVIDPGEADAILTLNDHVTAPTREWTDFVVEAIGEFVVNGTEPKGYVSEETADWLMARLDNDGRLESLTELEVLVRVLEKALGAPERLRAYALVQIERAVVFGTGPTRNGGMLDAGLITSAECAIVRRVIFAAGGDGPARVSRSEAEMLFRIKDATLGAANASEWERLFVQGVGNYLQGWQGAHDLPRERAAALETFMNDRTSRVGQFLGRVVRTTPTGFLSAARDGAGFGRKGAGLGVVAEAVRDHAVDGTEQAWLRGQIDADGETDPLEQALLRFLEAA